MKAVVHVVRAVIAVLDVHVIGVAPVEWPGIDEAEPVAAIVEAPMVVIAPADMKTVPVAEVRCVVLVGNATMSVATFDVTGRLGLRRARWAVSGIALRRASDRARLWLCWASHLLSLWLLRGRPGLLWLRLLLGRPGLLWLRLLPLRSGLSCLLRWRGPNLPLLLWRRPGLPLLRPGLLRVPLVAPLRIGGNAEEGKEKRGCYWKDEFHVGYLELGGLSAL